MILVHWAALVPNHSWMSLHQELSIFDKIREDWASFHILRGVYPMGVDAKLAPCGGNNIEILEMLRTWIATQIQDNRSF